MRPALRRRREASVRRAFTRTGEIRGYPYLPRPRGPSRLAFGRSAAAACRGTGRGGAVTAGAWARRVLLVEDEPLLASLMGQALIDSGFVVEVCTTESEGRRAARSSAAQPVMA
jgi:hypothetical protein